MQVLVTSLTLCKKYNIIQNNIIHIINPLVDNHNTLIFFFLFFLPFLKRINHNSTGKRVFLVKHHPGEKGDDLKLFVRKCHLELEKDSKVQTFLKDFIDHMNHRKLKKTNF